MLAIGAEALGDLGRQFAGRRQDQGPAAPARGGFAILGEPLKDGQGEGGGLAGAGLGDAQDIAALENQRNGLGLDRGGGGIAFGRKGLKERLDEAKRCKVGNGGQGRV